MNHYAGWKNALYCIFPFHLNSLSLLPNLYGSDLAIQITGLVTMSSRKRPDKA